jgi:hypothetical protein
VIGFKSTGEGKARQASLPWALAANTEALSFWSSWRWLALAPQGEPQRYVTLKSYRPTELADLCGYAPITMELEFLSAILTQFQTPYSETTQNFKSRRDCHIVGTIFMRPVPSYKGTRVIFLNYVNGKMDGRRGKLVMSAQEFREYADECMRSAKTAKSVKERRDFLQRAEAWLQAADRLETARRRRATRTSLPRTVRVA